MSPEILAIRGVLFDAGNTLVRVRGSVGAVYALVARRHGVAADGEVLELAFREAFQRRRGGFLDAVSRPHSAERERAWWRALVEEVFERASASEALTPNIDDLFPELYTEFEKADHWEVFPDVIPCLDDLAARRIPAGVLSNWDSRLHTVLDGLGLRDRFRFVLTSAEFGAEKPDAEIFREGARRLGCALDQVLHVGDLYRDDWLGATQAGLRGALLDRHDDCSAARPCVTHLGEIVSLLNE